VKLLNQSIQYLSISILAITTIWSIIFFINMFHEIKGSIDEGLENYKGLIIKNIDKDTSILSRNYFDESFFTITPIDKEYALSFKDLYVDTEVYMQDKDDLFPKLEPVRMLITAFEYDDKYYELKVANSMVEKEDLIRALFFNIIWLYVILIVGIIIVNNVVLKRVWRPFYHLLSLLENYRLGSTPEIPKVKTETKEFSDLQKSINVLLTENRNLYEQQKRFIGNASHELQTPLAIAINKLELLLESRSLKDAQAEELTEIYQIIQRMIRLNKSLLLLSKIENKQFIKSQRINMNEVIQQTKDELEDYASFKNIQFLISEKVDLNIEMNLELANIVVSNLFRNSIFHNYEGGIVEIEILPHGIKICNTGIDEPLHSEDIFAQFYKSNISSGGTGLGLAIVKAILDLYSFSISYIYGNKKHCMIISFK